MNTVHRIAVAGLLMGALLVLPGCGGESAGGAKQIPAELTGVEWALVSSSISASDLGAAGITAAFDGVQMAGFSGVNQYSGPYTAKNDGTFKVGEIAGTLMAGEESAMKAEQAYLKQLALCDGFSIADGKLTLSTDGEASLVFEQAEVVQLPGTKWTVTGYNNGKQAVTSSAVDSTLTIEFGTDGTIAGTGGVNRYNGSFKATAKAIEIGELATTMMAGPDELMAQETAFLEALKNSESWSVIRGNLEMRDASGAMQISASPETE